MASLQQNGQNSGRRRRESDAAENSSSNDGTVLLGNSLFDNDLSTFWEFDRQTADGYYTGSVGFQITFKKEINFNSLVIRVPDKHLTSFSNICLFVESEKIVCSSNAYPSKGDFLIFEAPTTLVAADIQLQWSDKNRYAAVAELYITYGELKS